MDALNTLEAFLSSVSPAIAILTILIIYCIKGVIIVIPVTALYISAGAVLPPIPAILLSYAGLAVEMTIGYYTGKSLGLAGIRSRMEKYKMVRQFIEFNKNNSQTVCILARLLPLNIDMMNMFFGATGVEYPRFLLFSLIGVSPAMITSVLIGMAVTNPFSKEFLIPLGVKILLIVCAFVMFYLQRRRSEP